MSFKTEIEDKIIELKKVISEKYPNHCRSCNGRGGSVIDWYEGTKKFCVCDECVGKGLDPLDPSLKLNPPKNYGLYFVFQDGICIERWESLEDEPESYISPTLNRELNDGWKDSWFDTPMGQVVSLQNMIRDLNSLRKEFDILIGKSGA